MAGLRIAIVAEGRTDQVVLTAALRAICPEEPIIRRLLPERLGRFETTSADSAANEQGWCGVLQWCLRNRRIEGGAVEDNPALRVKPFDLLVLHLDADVAEAKYSYCKKEIAEQAARLEQLPAVDPSPAPCPPVGQIVHAVKRVLYSWLSPSIPGLRTIVCIPSKDIESWVAAALPKECNIGIDGDIECDPNVFSRLQLLPKGLRIRRKREGEYKKQSQRITESWPKVREKCSQAHAFERDVRGAMLITEVFGA